MILGDVLWGPGSDDARARAFRWLTRIGAGRHFPGMPIGWYQQHQCAALEILKQIAKEAGCPPTFKACCSKGVIYGYDRGGNDRGPRRVRLCTARELFEVADRAARNGL